MHTCTVGAVDVREQSYMVMRSDTMPVYSFIEITGAPYLLYPQYVCVGIMDVCYSNREPGFGMFIEDRFRLWGDQTQVAI